MKDAARKSARRVIAAVVGGTLVLIGAALLVLPGPGILVLAAGLAVLAAEYAWARAWLVRLRRKISDVSRARRVRSR